MSLEEIKDLANYLLGRLQSKDFHFMTSIARCSLLSLRRDVSLMDEAYAEYIPRVTPICPSEKHVVKVEDLTIELPRLLRCGDAIVLPKLMMLREKRQDPPSRDITHSRITKLGGPAPLPI